MSRITSTRAQRLLATQNHLDERLGIAQLAAILLAGTALLIQGPLVGIGALLTLRGADPEWIREAGFAVLHIGLSPGDYWQAVTSSTVYIWTTGAVAAWLALWTLLGGWIRPLARGSVRMGLCVGLAILTLNIPLFMEQTVAGLCGLVFGISVLSRGEARFWKEGFPQVGPLFLLGTLHPRIREYARDRLVREGRVTELAGSWLVWIHRWIPNHGWNPEWTRFFHTYVEESLKGVGYRGYERVHPTLRRALARYLKTSRSPPGSEDVAVAQGERTELILRALEENRFLFALDSPEMEALDLDDVLDLLGPDTPNAGQRLGIRALEYKLRLPETSPSETVLATLLAHPAKEVREMAISGLPRVR